MSITFCAYPWDLIGDPEAVQRVRDAGADGVAIAAAYHSVRAATPLHPQHRIVDATSAALYVPTRAEAWGRLRPTTETPWVGEDAFGRAAQIARAAGLRVEAWVVLTHSTAVGERAPEFCVTNAFGEVYPYALCPSHPDVRHYAATLVTEVAAGRALDGLMLEACGPLGVGHLGHHDKVAGADWSAATENLLSLCFCSACCAALAAIGENPEELRQIVRTRIDGDESLDGLESLLGVRERARRALLEQCVSAARAAGVDRVVVHAQPDRWATGPFAALLDDTGIVDGVVLPDAVAHNAEQRDAVRARIGSTHDGATRDGAPRVGGYLWALPPADPASIRAAWPATVAALDDVYIYHLGLISRARLQAVSAAVTAGSAAAPGSTPAPE